MSKYVAVSAKIGKGCTLGYNVVILDGVQIGDNVYIGHNVVIHEGTKIGDRAFIDDGSILGRAPRLGLLSVTKASKGLPPLEIGSDCVISANVVLYAGTVLGKGVFVGDLAFIRERTILGNTITIGAQVGIQPKCRIGNGVRVQTGSRITAGSVLEDNVFIGAEVSTNNDNKMGAVTASEHKGPYIKRGARVGSNSTLLAGVVIGERAVVAAGSLVSRDVPDRKVVMGIPARVVREVSDDEFPPIGADA